MFPFPRGHFVYDGFTGGLYTGIRKYPEHAKSAVHFISKENLMFHSKPFTHFTLLAAIALTGIARHAHAQANPFAGRMSNVATNAQQFVVADVTGDGVPDIITANNDGLGLAVAQGQPNGTFDPPVAVGPAYYAVGVAVADVNGDGKLDIVAIQNAIPADPTYSRNAVSVLINASSPGFMGFYAPVVYTQTLPSAIVLADMNGDGKPDIVTTDNSTGLMQVRFNTGTAFTTTTNNIYLPFYPKELVAGDLDGDGKMDLAASDTNGYKVYLIRNRGGGGAFDISYLAYNDYTNHVALADMDGDGKTDILTTTNVLGSSPRQYQVLIAHNKGGMSFGDEQYLNAGTYITSLTTADANGDGKPDIITSDSFSSVVSVLLNKGNGTFAPAANYNGAGTPSYVTVADTNADGKSDLLVMSAVSGYVAVLNGVGITSNRTFSDNKHFGQNYSDRVAVADMNRDGIPDLVTIDYNGKTVGISLGRGDATFSPPIIYGLVGGPTDVKIGDTDGDGIPDIILALPNNGKLEILRGYGNGYFNVPIFVNLGGSPFRILVDFIDSLSYPDIVVGGYDGTVKILYGRGTPNYTVSETITGFQAITSLAVFQSGTKKYIAALDSSAFKMNILAPSVVGNTGFHVQTNYTTYQDSDEITVADFDRNGQVDLLTGTINSGGYTYMYGSGNGFFTPPSFARFSLGAVHVAFADLNADGLNDLVFSSLQVGAVQIAYGKASGGYTLPVESYAAGSSGGQSIVADLDGDGFLDVVTTGTGPVTILHHINTDTRSVSGHITLEGIDPNGALQDITLRFLPIGGPALIRHALVGPDGAFTVGSLPKKNYSVHVKGVKYLAANGYAYVADNNITDFNVLLHVGDANDDNVVDIGDFGLLVNSYGTSITDPNFAYDVRADFNADGVIDIADFGLLVNSYGLSGAL